jgi:hypothetical protein
MNRVENILSPERIAAIRSDLRAIPDAPVGLHLTAEQSLAYAKASLPADAKAALDCHAASCLDCATNLERWITVVELFTNMFAEVREFWRRLFPRLAVNFDTTLKVEITSPDRTIGLYLVENKGGDLELRVGSRHLECAGRTVRLRVGDWHRDLRLQQVDAEEVGGTTIITRQEREKFPEGAVPEVELLP